MQCISGFLSGVTAKVWSIYELRVLLHMEVKYAVSHMSQDKFMSCWAYSPIARYLQVGSLNGACSSSQDPCRRTACESRKRARLGDTSKKHKFPGNQMQRAHHLFVSFSRGLAPHQYLQRARGLQKALLQTKDRKDWRLVVQKPSTPPIHSAQPLRCLQSALLISWDEHQSQSSVVCQQTFISLFHFFSVEVHNKVLWIRSQAFRPQLPCFNLLASCAMLRLRPMKFTNRQAE